MMHGHTYIKFAKFVRFQHNSVWKYDRVYVEFTENADH